MKPFAQAIFFFSTSGGSFFLRAEAVADDAGAAANAVGVAKAGYRGAVVEAEEVALGASLIFENMLPPLLTAGVPKEGVVVLPNETLDPVDFLMEVCNRPIKEGIR